MDALALHDAHQWAVDNFTDTALTDARLQQRNIQIAARLATRPRDSFPHAMRREAE